MIQNEQVPLFVGCTKQNLCNEVERMPRSSRYFTAAPRTGELRQLARDELSALARDAELARLDLTQRIPEGLAYVPGSAIPEPRLASEAGRAVLSWAWEGAQATGPHTVTYLVAPVREGVWSIDGDMQFTDAIELQRTLPLPVRAITVEGPCEPVVTPPTPTPTATTEPPTATRLPDTPTLVPPTATPLPTPVPEPVFLPVSLRFTCKPDEHLGDIALVVDMSTSMDRLTPDGIAKKQAVLEAARTFVGRLDLTPNELSQSDQVAVVGFNDRAWLEQALTADGLRISAALDRLVAGQASGTRLDLAFEAGLAALDPSLRRPANKPVIILLTDGVPNGVPADPATGSSDDTVVAAAGRAKGQGVTVYTIGFGTTDESADPADRVNAQLLARCATDAGKAYIDPRADRLLEIYSQIADVFTCPPRNWP